MIAGQQTFIMKRHAGGRGGVEISIDGVDWGGKCTEVRFVCKAGEPAQIVLILSPRWQFDVEMRGYVKIREFESEPPASHDA